MYKQPAMLPRINNAALGALVAAIVLAQSACSAGTVEGLPGIQLSPPMAQQPALPSAVLTVGGFRESGTVVASGGSAAPYNYGPAALRDGAQYRLWWCSQLPGAGPPGDDILYASSSSPSGPYGVPGAAAAAVFSGRPGAFDGMHTCDPSVLKTSGRYYLYYTGASGDHAHGNAIGVASSQDGLTWQRESGGNPIVLPSHEVNRANVYGAGQPSAVYLDGWFYLMFTDTTASGAGWNGAGQFVLRASDPQFSRNVEELTDSGFHAVDSTHAPRPRSIVDAFSADWMWVDALAAFAIAHQTTEGTRITFWDRDFAHHPYEPIVVAGAWQEGPGLVRQVGGHAPIPVDDPCETVPIDVLRATALNPAPTDLKQSGLNVTGVNACADPERARAVLNGFAVPSPQRTVDVVLGGKKLRIERRSVAETISRRIMGERVPALEDLPVQATIPAQAMAVRSPEGKVGLLDDHGQLWTVRPESPELNGSPVVNVSQRVWNSLPQAGDLSGMHA